MTSPALLVDSVVCAAAEAMQLTPQAVRAALVAAFERADALGMSTGDVLGALTAEPGPRVAKARAKGV